ncbi:MAG: Hpt domain-containing protein, partial [bacterium]
MVNAELYSIFLDEASEIVESLETGLLELEKNSDNDEMVNEVFRAAHTLKGSSGMVDFNDLSEFVHEVEDVLSRIRNGSVKISKKLITVFLQSVDLIKLMVEKGPGKSDEDLLHAVEANRNELRKYRQSVSKKAHKTEKKHKRSEDKREKFIQVDLKFRPDIFLTGTDPLMLIREMEDYGDIVRVRCYTDAVPDIEEIQYDKFYLSWSMIIKTTASLDDIDGIFIFVKDENPIKINDVSSHFIDGVDKRYADKKLGEILDEEGHLEQKDFEDALEGRTKKSGEILLEQKKLDKNTLGKVLDRQKKSKKILSESTIRVGTGKLDKLVNLVGEMVNGISRISQQLESVKFSKYREINDTVETLERMSKDVQEQVMKVRMIPLEGTFKKFQRLVRDMANQLDKKIALHIEGSENELDKTV